jgi:hypothetical protein
VKRRKPRRPPLNLAEALPHVAGSYRRFVAGQVDEADTKAFTAHHSAAKTALSHLEQLMKLASDAADDAATDPADIALGEARQEMDDEEQEMPADDTGEPG